MGELFKAVQTSLLVPRQFYHIYTSFYPYSHSKTLSRHFRLLLPLKISFLLIFILYCFLFFSVHLDCRWNLWYKSLVFISMLYLTKLSVDHKVWIENLTRIFQYFFIFFPFVIRFDLLFGFVLVVWENMSIYIHIVPIWSFSSSFKPSKHVPIVINSDSAVFRGKNMGCCQKCDKVHHSAK